MVINFVGNFQNGYVGEVADETHIARELEALGHTVRRIPRDAWREYVIENFPDKKYDVPEVLQADCNIITKWHHFYSGMFAVNLRELSGGPVFYWVWDYMCDGGIIDWHKAMIEGSDLYLGNDVMAPEYQGIPNKYYFPFDCFDKEITRVNWSGPKDHDVVFFGSYLEQGDRAKILPVINKQFPIKVYSWNHEEWQKKGFDASPAVYGYQLAAKISLSKIVLGVNVNDYTWGYWSNRVGKTLGLGGFLLQRYVPGMELFVKEGCTFFNDTNEAMKKIDYYLNHEEERKEIANRGYQIGRNNFTSEVRTKQLSSLMERYLHGKSKKPLV